MILKKSKCFEVDVEKDINGFFNYIEKSFGGGIVKDKDVIFNKNVCVLRLKKILILNFFVKVVKIC